MKLSQVCFGTPTPDAPYYHLKLRLDDAPAADLELCEVRVNGTRNRDFTAVCDGKKKIPAGYAADAASREAYIRVDWARGDVFEVELDLKDTAGALTTVSGRFVANADNGYWDKAWRYYASHVLTETSGHDRVQEPVHLVLGLYQDRIQDPEAEIRVVGPPRSAARSTPPPPGTSGRTSTASPPPRCRSPFWPTCPPTPARCS